MKDNEDNVPSNVMKPFFLNWKKTTLAVSIWLASLVLHNLLSGLWGNNEEVFFFIIAIFVMPLYFLIASTYTLLTKWKGKKP